MLSSVGLPLRPIVPFALAADEIRPGDTTADCGLFAHLLLYGDPTLKGDSDDALRDRPESESDLSCGGLVECWMPLNGIVIGDPSPLPPVVDRVGVFGPPPILDNKALS